jgi:hypothetical protein
VLEARVSVITLGVGVPVSLLATTVARCAWLLTPLATACPAAALLLRSGSVTRIGAGFLAGVSAARSSRWSIVRGHLGARRNAGVDRLERWFVH